MTVHSYGAEDPGYMMYEQNISDNGMQFLPDGKAYSHVPVDNSVIAVVPMHPPRQKEEKQQQ